MVASPCIRVCRQNRDAGICEGCGRRPLEVITWSRMGEDERAVIRAELPLRLKALG